MKPTTRSLLVGVLVLGLSGAVLSLWVRNRSLQKKYQSAVLASTMQAWDIKQVVWVDARDGVLTTDSLMQVDSVIARLRQFEMNNPKTASVVFDFVQVLNGDLTSLSPENRNFINEISREWRGKELGFSDRW